MASLIEEFGKRRVSTFIFFFFIFFSLYSLLLPQEPSTGCENIYIYSEYIARGSLTVTHFGVQDYYMIGNREKTLINVPFS